MALAKTSRYAGCMPLAMVLLLPRPADEDVGRVPACDKAAATAGVELLKKTPGTVVVVQAAPFTPTDAFTPPTAEPAAVNVLGLDKASSAGFSFDVDLEFIDELAARARPAGWAVKRLPQIEFEPATLAALSTTGLTSVEAPPKLVVVTLPYRSPTELVDLGLVLGGVAKASERSIAIVVVANLASRLTGSEARAEAAKFDKDAQAAITANDLTSLVRYDEAALEAAGEEATRPLALTHGALKGAGNALTAKLQAYEAPGRVGYAVATWS